MEGEIEGLECSLCFDLLEEPKQLSCSHTFCQKCLSKWYHCETTVDQISCVLCREITHVKDGDVSNLQTNIQAQSMVDDFRNTKRECTVCDPDAKSSAAAYCQKCGEYMCDECLITHQSWKKNVHHEVVNVKDIRSGKVKVEKLCSEHPCEERLWVCTTCHVAICLRCHVINHITPNHEVEEIDNFKRRWRNQIDETQFKAQNKYDVLEAHVRLINEQDAKVVAIIEETMVDIQKAYETSVTQLTNRKNDLLEECRKHKQELRAQLGEFREDCTKLMISIDNTSRFIGNGVQKLIVGPTEEVQNNLHLELERKLCIDDPNEAVPRNVTTHAQHIEFIEYPERRKLHLGQVVQKKMWVLKRHSEHPLSGQLPWCMGSISDRRIAVGYGEGGLEIFTLRGSQGTVLQTVNIASFATLSHGRYVVRERGSACVALYGENWERLNVSFSTNGEGGGTLNVDRGNKIYIGSMKSKKILVFKAGGGMPIKEIPCCGFQPQGIYPMHQRNMLVVNDGCTVRVIDKEGSVKHSVSGNGALASPVVLRDDTILIGWRKDNLLNIDLYTAQLVFLRSVLTNFHAESVCDMFLTELCVDLVAFNDDSHLYIFQKTD